jgi:hypothetical protein
MNKLKKWSLISVGIIILGVLILALYLISLMNLSNFLSMLVNNYWIFIVLIFLILYFIMLIIVKHSSKWIKASYISNLVGAILFIILLVITIILYFVCLNYHDECRLGLIIYTYLNFFITGIFLAIGFILLLIGILKK